MIKISALISTNCPDENRWIEKGAIEEFTNLGFSENLYDATISFSCAPRCFNPDDLQMIVEGIQSIVKEGQNILAWGCIASGIIKFFRKAHGYRKTVILRQNEKESVIEIYDGMSEEELRKQIEDNIVQTIEQTKETKPENQNQEHNIKSEAVELKKRQV